MKPLKCSMYSLANQAYIMSINLKQKKKILAIHELTLRCSSWKGCSGNSGNGTFLFSTSENNFTTRLVKSSKDSTRKQTMETGLKLIITPSGQYLKPQDYMCTCIKSLCCIPYIYTILCFNYISIMLVGRTLGSPEKSQDYKKESLGIF